MIGRLVPPSHPLPLGNNHPSLSRDPITAQPRAQTWWLRASTALPAPPSGLQLPGVGRARRAAIDCGGRRRRRSGGAGGLGGCTASVGVTAGCRLWCTTHNHPQAKATRTQPTRCLDLSQPEKKNHQKVPVWKTILHPDCKAQRHKREGGMEGINLVARPWQMPC